MSMIRAVRKERAMTLDALAERTGLTKSYLSKVERRLSVPSIASAMKIADALNVDVGQLFSDQGSREHLAVERAAPPDGLRYRPVAVAMPGKAMSPFMVFPTAEFEPDTHPAHRGQEFIFVHTGTIELDYDGRTTILNTGDSAYLDASAEHRMRSIGPAPAQVVVVARNDT